MCDWLWRRNHRLQPLALFGDGVVHAFTQLDLDLLESRHHAVTPCLSLKLEGSAAGLSTDEDESQEREGFWLAQPAPLSSASRIAAELQQPGLVPVKFEPELLEPRSHRIPKTPRVGLVLEAGHDIVGVPHDDHVASGFPLAPLHGPEVEDVVQEDGSR